MIGYKAAYNDQIEYGINLSNIGENGVALPEERFDKESRSGFSLYKDLMHALENYYIKGMRFYKVESEGNWVHMDQNTVLVEGFDNIKELKRTELYNFIKEHQDEMFASTNPLIRKAVVSAGFKIDEALSDEAACVRAEVANQRNYLDILENDESIAVIYAVVKQNHNLEKFLKHDDYDVRVEAKKRYKALKYIGAIENKEV